SHRGQTSVERMKKAWPNARLVHLPVHSSWLNQVEIYFSVLQRKVLTPNDFRNVEEVEARILGFQDRYQELAEPFEWKFTREDLVKLMRRLEERERQAA
ncbi:MAG: transposase, partial [Actinomycetota bacterium]|nr:transposase [Actinomycetota bacterium]